MLIGLGWLPTRVVVTKSIAKLGALAFLDTLSRSVLGTPQTVAAMFAF
jgi:hypothetical protein